MNQILLGAPCRGGGCPAPLEMGSHRSNATFVAIYFNFDQYTLVKYENNYKIEWKCLTF